MMRSKGISRISPSQMRNFAEQRLQMAAACWLPCSSARRQPSTEALSVPLGRAAAETVFHFGIFTFARVLGANDVKVNLVQNPKDHEPKESSCQTVKVLIKDLLRGKILPLTFEKEKTRQCVCEGQPWMTLLCNAVVFAPFPLALQFGNTMMCFGSLLLSLSVRLQFLSCSWQPHQACGT